MLIRLTQTRTRSGAVNGVYRHLWFRVMRHVPNALAAIQIGGGHDLDGAAFDLQGDVARLTAATIILDGEGQPVLCAGAAGGSRIVTAIQQVVMNQLLLGMDVERALNAPRVHHQAHPNILRFEEFAPLPEALIAELAARGHETDDIRNVANVQTIRIHRTGDGVRLVAGSDPRKGGLPAGR